MLQGVRMRLFAMESLLTGYTMESLLAGVTVCTNNGHCLLGFPVVSEWLSYSLQLPMATQGRSNNYCITCVDMTLLGHICVYVYIHKYMLLYRKITINM